MPTYIKEYPDNIKNKSKIIIPFTSSNIGNIRINNKIITDNNNIIINDIKEIKNEKEKRRIKHNKN